MFFGIDGQLYSSELQAIDANRVYWNETLKAHNYAYIIGRIDVKDEEKLNNILNNIILELKNHRIPWKSFMLYYDIFEWIKSCNPHISTICDLAIGLRLAEVYCYLGAAQQQKLNLCKKELANYVNNYFSYENVVNKLKNR